MFLDPDPKRQKQTMSSFLPTQSPVASPRDPRPGSTQRKPLHERTKSQNNRRTPSRSPVKTVRLVAPSPSSSVQLSSDSEDGKENKKVEPQGRLPRFVPQFDATKGASVLKPVSTATARVNDVSDTHRPTNQAQRGNVKPSSLLSTSGSHRRDAQSEWHPYRAASDNYSQSSTLRADESEVSLGIKSDRRQRISEGTTLRGTPPPDDQQQDCSEVVEAEEAEESEEPEAGQESEVVAGQDLGVSPALPALPETSPIRSTVRAVQPSIASSSSPPHFPAAVIPSGESLSRPQTATLDSDPAPNTSPESFERRSSLDESDLHSVRDYTRPSAALGYYRSQESLAQSEVTIPQTSSPNFIAYSPSSPTRSRSRTHPLHYTTSFESINSRLERSPTFRPDTGRSFTTNRSLVSQSSHDTLPPLEVPKKRIRHQAGSLSLNSHASSTMSSAAMSNDGFDTEPWPRQPYSSHLSTIASESDRTSSQQLSQFSFGSGILTCDDSSILHSGTWSRPHRQNAPTDSARPSPAIPDSSSEEEPGDMTLGIFRETSLVPQPLFKEMPPFSKPESAQIHSLPPIIRIPESDEHVDTLSALQAPPLRQKRSGYSIRQRSNSMPSQPGSISQISNSESERWSHGSTLFPTWARHYYAGTAVLSSKVSMSSIGTIRVRPANHSRAGSARTERSFTSRLGTGHSNVESGRSAISGSPASSPFLPSIFRPRTRPPVSRENPRRSRKSYAAAEQDERPDSMVIAPAPQVSEDGNEILPSGQPRWGSLKDDATPSRALPRAYSRQKDWNTMQFPRPMTKDQLSDYAIPRTHLVPSRRQERSSAWRPPSFVESLDTLIHSRHNRQILMFSFGFICPLLWMLGAVLPLPPRPRSTTELGEHANGSTEDLESAMMKHEAGDAERRWREEQTYLKGRWWRTLNRIMSVVGVLVIGAVIALAIVATR